MRAALVDIGSLLPIIARRPRLFAETVLWSLVTQLGILAIALGLALIVGRAAAGAGTAAAAGASSAMVLALLGVAVLVAATTWRESWVSHGLAYSLIGILRSSVFRALRRSLPERRPARRTGDLVSTIVGDIETLEWLYAHTVAQMLTAGAVLLVSTLVSLSITPMLLIVWVPLLAVGVAVPLLTSRSASHRAAELSEHSAALRSDLLDTLRGMRELRGARALPAQLDSLDRATRSMAQIQVAEARRLGMERGVGEGVFALAAVGAIGILALRADSLDPALAPLAVMVSLAGLGPAAQIADLLRGASTLREAAGRIRSTLDLPPALPDCAPPQSSAPRTAEHGLVLDGVSFDYVPGTPLLSGFDLRVLPGERVALVGPSGAGKTTVARLIARLWDPDAGAIRVHGVDLRAMSDADRTARVGVVPQSSPLLRGTIRENIRLAAPDMPEEQVREAAELTGILDPGTGLPQGLETMVRENGDGLSGGQRARVAIARALVRSPEVLVLDEATASLDAGADAAILDVLGRLDCAVLLIAHRDTTIAAADRVVRLGEGAGPPAATGPGR